MGSGKKPTKPWRQPVSPERVLTANAEPTTSFSIASQPATTPAAVASPMGLRPVSVATSSPQFAFTGTAVPLSAFGGSTLASSGTIGPQAGSASLNPSGGFVPSSSSGSLQATAVAAANLFSAPKAKSVSQNTNVTEVAGMLVAVIELFKSRQIDLNQKAKLKTLALVKDRRIVAAYKTFAVDHDLNEFVDTLKLLCQTA